MRDYLLNLYKELEEKTGEASNEFMEDRKNGSKREDFMCSMSQSELMEKILDDLNIEAEQMQEGK